MNPTPTNIFHPVHNWRPGDPVSIANRWHSTPPTDPINAGQVPEYTDSKKEKYWEKHGKQTA
jgi:hypothetical protein